MRQSLGLRQGMSLAMTPALQQAIRMLQMSTQDLQQEIQDALDSNLLLEPDEDESAASTEADIEAAADADSTVPATAPEAEDIPQDLPVDADWSDLTDDLLPTGSASGADDGLRDFLDANLHLHGDLQAHLRAQLKLLTLTPVDYAIAEFVVDAVDEDGYLRTWDELLSVLIERSALDATHIESVLRRVQQFDPPGVAARDLDECLQLQLRQLDLPDQEAGAAQALLDLGLMRLARNDHQAAMRAQGFSERQIAGAVSLIRTLQPHPGRAFTPHEASYVTPDVVVKRKDGRWQVALNREHLPRVRINARYQALIKRADTSPDQQQLKQHLGEARSFINNLESRHETILRVAHCLVEQQRDFLEHGPEAMRPMVLRDIAEQLGIHESTVSRATANKYMLTPSGLYEFKFFFSSHVHTTGGGQASSTAIQAMIKRLVDAESPGRPLSDAALAQHLLDEGVQVARRTVAKYREALKIAPSHQRKQTV